MWPAPASPRKHRRRPPPHGKQQPPGALDALDARLLRTHAVTKPGWLPCTREHETGPGLYVSRHVLVARRASAPGRRRLACATPCAGSGHPSGLFGSVGDSTSIADERSARETVHPESRDRGHGRTCIDGTCPASARRHQSRSSVATSVAVKPEVSSTCMVQLPVSSIRRNRSQRI
jgi:hypothetical protein